MRLSPHERGRVLSVYAGAGGLDLGLELAGFDPILCLDSEPVARSTLKSNRPGWFVPEDGDVASASKRHKPEDFGMAIGDLDLLAGGPPCQPFSKAAQWTSSAKRGLSDPRAESLVGMLDLVEAFLPRAVLIENVAGFLRGSGSALPQLEAQIAQINRRSGSEYTLRWWLVDAADYGVPQNRTRAIAVAFRDDVQFSLPAATHADQPIRAWDVLHDLVEKDLPTPTGSWTRLLASVPEGSNYQWLTARGGGEELFGWRTRYWSFLLKLAKDRPSWTLPASPGPNTGPFHWDNRPLTVRERLRLQSFPDDWELVGGFREQLKLAGNATPPLLAEVLGNSIAAALNIHSGRQTTLVKERQRDVPKAVPPRAIPTDLRGLVAPRLAHPGTGLGPSPRSI